jgi:hypothetical protein
MLSTRFADAVPLNDPPSLAVEPDDAGQASEGGVALTLASVGEMAMTESEWLACEDPTKMLLFIRGHRTMRKRVKQRKQRLFAVACCLRLRPLLDDERSRRCIEVVEGFADARATAEELRVAETEAREIWLKAAADDTAFACLQLCAKEVDGLHVSTTTISAVFERQKREANEPFDPLDDRRSGACPSEERAQCVLIREIFGNPFRPVTIAPAWCHWQDGTLPKLAQAIYEERAFDRLPILADALEEAGCTNANILNHCRQPGEHVRGCWVVDAILGKT